MASTGSLPLIDEHSYVVGASAQATYDATKAFLDDPLGGLGRRYAGLVGVRGDRPFVLDRDEPPHLLTFAGEHRYARYALVFTLHELGPERTELTLRSEAEFPGVLGRGYRVAVIGTRFHVLAVRWMLRRIGRAAVRTS